MVLSCSVITTPEELETQRFAWEELCRASTSGSPMLTPTWLLPWWRIFGRMGRRKLAVATFFDGDRLVGLAPFVRDVVLEARAVPYRRLAWLGTGEAERDEVCSEYLAPIAEPGFERDVAARVAEAIATEALGEWDELVLPAMDGATPWPALLAAELEDVGVRVEQTQTSVARCVELPATFAEYLAGASSSSRYLLRRSMRELEAWAKGDVELRVASTPHELDFGRSVLMTLHGERWQQGGAFRSSRFVAFQDEVMASLFARGELELLWLTARGEPIAAAYNIIFGDTVYFYQSGRRIELPKSLRPGIALHAHAIRHAIEAGKRRYDFMAGAAPYKQQLATSERPLVQLRATRAPVRDRACAVLGSASLGARKVATWAGAGQPKPVAKGPALPDGPTAMVFGDLNLVRCFAGTGVPTLVLGADPTCAAFFSRHAAARRIATDPRDDPARTVRDLVQIGRVFTDKPVLFYGDDALLKAVSDHRDVLAEAARFLLPPREVVDDVLDKVRFVALAERLGLPVPASLVADGLTTVEAILERIPLPCILKPASHVGWTKGSALAATHGRPAKVLAARDRDELARMMAAMTSFTTSFVAQEWIAGGEDLVHSFHAYIRADGTPLGHYVGRKIRTYPMRSGVSTYLELTIDEEVTHAGLDCIRRIGLVGPAKLDFKRDPRTGRLRLLEVNARFSLWNRLGAKAGINVPHLAYLDLTGQPCEPVTRYATDTRWLAFGDDARTFLREYRPSGELTTLGWLRSLRGPKVYDVFSWDDPSPFLVDVARSVRQRAGRALGGAT